MTEIKELNDNINAILNQKSNNNNSNSLVNNRNDYKHKYDIDIIDNYGFAWFTNTYNNNITSNISNDKNFENHKSLDLMIDYYNLNDCYLFNQNIIDNNTNSNNYLILREKQNNHWSNFRYQQAKRKLSQRDYDKGLYYINEGLSINPQSIDCLLLKGEILQLQGHNHKALECFNEIIKLDSNYIVINNEIKRLDSKLDSKIDNKHVKENSITLKSNKYLDNNEVNNKIENKSYNKVIDKLMISLTDSTNTLENKRKRDDSESDSEKNKKSNKSHKHKKHKSKKKDK